MLGLFFRLPGIPVAKFLGHQVGGIPEPIGNWSSRWSPMASWEIWTAQRIMCFKVKGASTQLPHPPHYRKLPWKVRKESTFWKTCLFYFWDTIFWFRVVKIITESEKSPVKNMWNWHRPGHFCSNSSMRVHTKNPDPSKAWLFWGPKTPLRSPFHWSGSNRWSLRNASFFSLKHPAKIEYFSDGLKPPTRLRGHLPQGQNRWLADTKIGWLVKGPYKQRCTDCAIYFSIP